MKITLNRDEIIDMVAEYIKFSYGIDFDKVSIDKFEGSDDTDIKISLDEIIISMEKL